MLIAVLVAMLLVGCGGGEVTSSSGGGEGKSASEQSAPSELLLKESDLPSGSAKAESLPEPCSPVPVLEEQDAQVATSPLYNLRTRYVAEAVGVAPSAQKAALALRDLQDEKRLECVKSTIEAFGPQEGVGVSLRTPVRVAQGEGGSLARLVEVDARSQAINSTVALSFKTGRCVATLLFIVRGKDSAKPFIDGMSSRAYDSLADAQGTCH